MSATSRLFRCPDPYDVAGTNELFLRAVRENCAYHYRRNESYRRILQGRDFSPHCLQREEDMAALPCLPTLLFKRHELYSMSP